MIWKQDAENSYKEVIREPMQDTPSHFEPQGSPPFHVDGVFPHWFFTNNIVPTYINMNTLLKSRKNKYIYELPNDQYR